MMRSIGRSRGLRALSVLASACALALTAVLSPVAPAAPAEAVCGDVVAPLPCASIHRGSKAAKAAAPSRYRRLKVSFSRC